MNLSFNNDTLRIYKFGGSCLADETKLLAVRDFIADQIKNKKESMAVVVSALGNTTNDLIELAHKFSKNPVGRELDVLVSSGERISMSLLSIALNDRGIKSKSLTGSQVAIITSNDPGQAQILGVKADRLTTEICEGFLPIVAGFQGVSLKKEITTLGRGGSDLTAVALGIAMKAKEVVLVKDVPGMYRDIENEKLGLVKQLHYSEAIALSFKGSGLIQTRALLLASKYKLPIRICSLERNETMSTLINETLDVNERSEIQAIQERKGFDLTENQDGNSFWNMIGGTKYYLTSGKYFFNTLVGKNFSTEFVENLLSHLETKFKIPLISVRFGSHFVDLLMDRNFLPEEKNMLLEKSLQFTEKHL